MEYSALRLETLAFHVVLKSGLPTDQLGPVHQSEVAFILFSFVQCQMYCQMYCSMSDVLILFNKKKNITMKNDKKNITMKNDKKNIAMKNDKKNITMKNVKKLAKRT